MKSLVLPRPRSLKTLDITIQAHFEDLLATPVALPTTEPADPQYEWTIASGDMPVFSYEIKSVKYIALFYVAGKNNDTVTRRVDIRMVKWDGSAWASVSTAGGNVSAANFYTRSCGFYNVSIGDLLGIKLWAAATAVDRDYEARQVHPSRLFLKQGNTEVMKPLDFSAVEVHPTLVEGDSPTQLASASMYYPPNISSGTAINSPIRIEESSQHETYGLFRAYRGEVLDSDSSSVLMSTTQRPRYYANTLPIKIITRSYGDID